MFEFHVGQTNRAKQPAEEKISEPQELYRQVTTPGIEVGTLLFCSDEVV
jgi:hypothetical protein